MMLAAGAHLAVFKLFALHNQSILGLDRQMHLFCPIQRLDSRRSIESITVRQFLYSAVLEP